MRVAILRNENPDSGVKWAVACKKAGIDFTIIDITSHDWFEEISKGVYDFFLLRPPGMLSHYKNQYDEKLYIICKILKLQTYPSYEECFLYENKKLLSYFFKAMEIPHPQTQVFYEKNEAINFIHLAELPLVAKTSIGASGSGVNIIKTKQKAINYINRSFSKRGIKRRFGPNKVTGSPRKWIAKAINNPKYLFKKVDEYFSIIKHSERDFVIFQEYIPHDFEWRVIRIGESYFAHKKIKYGEKASGSKAIEYVDPPISLLDFVHRLCEENNFHFMAVDIFEDDKRRYLVNEMQTIFGHVQEYLMTVDDKIGRYIYSDGKWVFESGYFNTNESYDLRLETAINLYEKGKR